MSRKTTNYKITVPDNDDFIDIETVSNAIEEFDNILFNVDKKVLKGTGAGFHSSIYRGKYLGTEYTAEQKAAIASGTFDDLFIGDYWTINNINWRIADFDYYYNVGDTAFNNHHVVIVPDTILYTAKMNTESVTTGCYTGSELYTTNLGAARTAFENAFGSTYIPVHRGLYSNATNDYGAPSGFAHRDMRVELMSEEQVFGHAVFGQRGVDVGTQKTQFKVFALDSTKISIRQRYWLTNVASSTNFACVETDGSAEICRAMLSSGVRPFACIVGA